MDYIAHTKCNGVEEKIIDHLLIVSKLAGEFASYIDMKEEAEIAGLYHDIGKYGDLFQERLKGKEKGIDHWTAGAFMVAKDYLSYYMAASIAIQGHHIGLSTGNAGEFYKKINIDNLKGIEVNSLRLSEKNTQLLRNRFIQQGGTFTETDKKCGIIKKETYGRKISTMLDVRMLYSCLVDADYICTEAHFSRNKNGELSFRDKGAEFNPEEAFKKYYAYMQEIKKKSDSSSNINRIRNDLNDDCLSAALKSRGMYTMTAPTGSGKTLSMLGFAINHARQNRIRRLIFVLPYLSIIDQTIEEYEKVFSDMGENGKPYILADHSLMDYECDNEGKLRLFSENWDAPIIVTTSLKFFESLFSNKPSKCRKLHNIANSIILFDEAQTLPSKLAIPTVAAMTHLTGRFGCSVVFSTATQPAFKCLSESIDKYIIGNYKPEEIVKRDKNLFERLERVKIHFHESNSSISWDELAWKISEEKQVLVIVNIKQHALELYKELIDIGLMEENLFYLTTTMCPAHRVDVLNKVKHRLKNKLPCTLVSTQCVEAGVDIDFPCVYRAFGPLEAIAQAAGRCNRNGKLKKGNYYVFYPREEKYPDKYNYSIAADTAKKIIKKFQHDKLLTPEVFMEYYRSLYKIKNTENEDTGLMNAINCYDFEWVDREYKLIENKTSIIVVPYKNLINDYNEAVNGYYNEKFSKKWIKSVAAISVNVYIQDIEKFSAYLESVKTREGENTGYYILHGTEYYDSKLGLVEKDSMSTLTC